MKTTDQKTQGTDSSRTRGDLASQFAAMADRVSEHDRG